MSRIISFTYTTSALQARRKTVTRRDWSPAHAARFKAGDFITAYDRSPRAGGRPMARLRLTHDVREECDRDAPDGDYEAEGFDYLTSHPELLPPKIAARVRQEGLWSRTWFDWWRRQGGVSHVIRFEILEIYP